MKQMKLLKNFLNLFCKNIKNDQKKKMRGSEFVFNSVDLLHYNLHKISLNRDGSNIDSPNWLKNKKATINPKNNDDKCFPYPLTVALNYEQIKKDPQRILKITPFIEQYDWKEIDFPSHKKDWKKFELNNKSIAINILYVPYKNEKIKYAYQPKYDERRKSKVIVLMIADGKKQHYLAVKSLSALLRGIPSKHAGDSYYLNCFHSYSTENKLIKHENVCKNHDYCYAEMPNEGNKILKYNHGEKFMELPFILYSNLESLLEKMITSHNNPEKSSTIKINEHTNSGYPLFTQCSFDLTKNNLDCYRDKDLWKSFVRI